MAEEIRQDASGCPTAQVALLGFSMGALMAVEVSQLLGLSLAHVFLAGRAFPADSPASPDISALNLADDGAGASESG